MIFCIFTLLLFVQFSNTRALRECVAQQSH